MSRPLSESDEFVTEGVGWMFFAGTIMGIAGIMRIFDGVWALRNKGVLPEEVQGGILGDSLSTHGWAWIIVGVALFVGSFLVVMRNQFARWIGIIGGAVLAITSLWSMPYYPVWSLTYVLLGILVVYGLAAHGGRTNA
jgi:hypothetical protein